jgi:hypothetical protein
MCSVMCSNTAICISMSLLCNVLEGSVCSTLIRAPIFHHIPQHIQVMVSNHWRVGKLRTCADYSVLGNIMSIILKLSVRCIFSSMYSVYFSN